MYIPRFSLLWEMQLLSCIWVSFSFQLIVCHGGRDSPPPVPHPTPCYSNEGCMSVWLLTWMPLPLVGTKASTVVVNNAPANFSLLLFVPCTGK